MIRTLLYLLAGVLLGGIIHIAVILVLPSFATHDIWTRVADLDAVNRIEILPDVPPGAPNPFGLDPELIYAVCQVNIADAPAEVSGVLPDGFWSLSVVNADGVVVYSTTNRDGIGQNLDLGIFNPTQTRLLAEQELDVAEGLLIVEAQDDDVFIAVRLHPPYGEMRPRYRDALAGLTCGNIQ